MTGDISKQKTHSRLAGGIRCTETIKMSQLSVLIEWKTKVFPEEMAFCWIHGMWKKFYREGGLWDGQNINSAYTRSTYSA